MLTANLEKPRWTFYLGWVVLNSLAIVAAWFLAWGLISLITRIVGDTITIAGEPRIIEDFLLLYVFFPIVGLLAGFLQFLLLRRYIPRLSGWILATFFGWLMPFITGFFILTVLGMENDPVSVMVGLLLIGASIAVPQWWLLRQRVGFAFWWILAYGFSWGLAGLLYLITTENPPALLALVLLPAMATAAACWLLLDWYPRQQQHSTVPG